VAAVGKAIQSLQSVMVTMIKESAKSSMSTSSLPSAEAWKATGMGVHGEEASKMKQPGAF